jgi:hypothetical protein
MPRHARLDVPGTLHHVMVRGIEGSNIFQNEEDRQAFKEGHYRISPFTVRQEGRYLNLDLGRANEKQTWIEAAPRSDRLKGSRGGACPGE